MKNSLLMGVVLLGVTVPSIFAHAATLYMDPVTTEINRGDTIAVSIRLDTDEGECVNAIDGVISYSENIQPIDTSRGNSIFSMWVEPPTINKEDRTITFAGGIPNGYCGRIIGDPRLTNTVAEIIFSSPGLVIGSTESGNVARVAFADGTRAFLNDGFGTEAPLRFFDSEIVLADKVGSRTVNEWTEVIANDFLPPEDFSISLERTENAFSNKYFVVFNTTDKQSGVDYYEILEEPIEDLGFFKWGATDAPWRRAQSPYLLRDQSLNTTILVRAYDKAGNEYVATLIPDEAQRTVSSQNKIMIALIATGLVAFVLTGVIFTVVRTRKRKQNLEEVYEE